MSKLAWLMLIMLFSINAYSQKVFESMTAAIASGTYGPINSLLVMQHDSMLYEQYFRGHEAEDLQLLNSLTKSVGATLIGIAVKRGLLDFEAPISRLLPQYDWRDRRLRAKADLTLHQLLSMRHGLDWDEISTGFTDPRNSAVQMFASPDWYRFTLGRARTADPGERFTYSTGVAGLMGAILRQATGHKPQTLFQQWLAGPLDIGSSDWELWSAKGPGHGIRRFPFDEAPLGVGLWLRPRDLLKLGQLYLAGGSYLDQQLIDRDWIKRSWTSYSGKHTGDTYFSPGTEAAGYGYQWWFREFAVDDGNQVACWYASGAGRQYLLICPELQLIVASTADAYDWNGPGVFNLMRSTILPHVNARLPQ